MTTTDLQNKLMQHTCGLSNGEKRNFFGTSIGGSDSDEFEKLVKAGLAIKSKAPSWSGDEVVYSLTEKGKKIAADTMPKPKKLTKSKQRYLRYLEYGDGFDSFRDYIDWDCDPERSWNGG